MQQFFKRHQPAQPVQKSLLAGLGGMLAIGLVGLLSHLSGIPWLMAPFGATAVLLFSVPASPLSQPANVVGGHLISAASALILMQLLPEAWWAIGFAVGVAIALMALLRITHPPAGANPIVIFLSQPGFDFLLFPVLIGSVALVVLAFAYHRLAKTASYPLDS
ncbi:HPP family protein [Coralliovum pocilloporae]|uniref:HPP family protein n=1 Tax=Coralliovum pocilloporae TaxID=3066369 RepID=UPI00330712EB